MENKRNGLSTRIRVNLIFSPPSDANLIFIYFLPELIRKGYSAWNVNSSHYLRFQAPCEGEMHRGLTLKWAAHWVLSELTMRSGKTTQQHVSWIMLSYFPAARMIPTGTPCLELRWSEQEKENIMLRLLEDYRSKSMENCQWSDPHNKISVHFPLFSVCSGCATQQGTWGTIFISNRHFQPFPPFPGTAVEGHKCWPTKAALPSLQIGIISIGSQWKFLFSPVNGIHGALSESEPKQGQSVEALQPPLGFPPPCISLAY